MKTLILVLALCSATSVASAATQPNPPRVRFEIVDHAPRPPYFSKATLWRYIRWLRVY